MRDYRTVKDARTELIYCYDTTTNNIEMVEFRFRSFYGKIKKTIDKKTYKWFLRLPKATEEQILIFNYICN